MLGFSLQKIMLLVAIVGAIWWGFNFVTRLQKARDLSENKKKSPGWRRPSFRKTARPAEPQETDPEDMVQCPTCKAFVAARGVKSCGKANCPY